MSKATQPAATAVAAQPPAAKPLRADAARNRAKLIEVATTVYADRGVDVPLEDIAKSAGVGIGTLYRHFPTRCDLVLAVYGHQVQELAQQARALPLELPPGAALREWMRSFADYYALKMGMINLLRSMMDGNQDTFRGTRESLLDSAARVLTAAVEAGAVRPDATGQELLRALGGICLASTTPEGQETTLALVDLVYDGLRFGAPNPER
ncbi:TetR/AcrR family transcriptional regulator [Calidifontibacter terrae]